MYLPSHFEQPDARALHALVRAYPLATLVTQGADGLSVNHVPLLLAVDEDGRCVLHGHVARANPLWRDLGDGADSVAVFTGPQGYVTPNWYASKREHAKVVPTWNYAVVHAHGRLRAIDDRDWLLALVTRLTQAHEAAQPRPWRVDDAPADFVEHMLEMIVGIEMPVERLLGKTKMSQNRSPKDRRGVADGLVARGDDNALAMAALVAGDDA